MEHLRCLPDCVRVLGARAGGEAGGLCAGGGGAPGGRLNSPQRSDTETLAPQESMSPGLQVGAAPASGLLRSFERADASLALASQKLEGEFAQNFSGAADSRLNPMRLLKRLAALEEELPTLREAAEKNAIARRTVLGTLHAQHITNHAQMSALAQRAHAPVDEASVEWKLAEQTASLCIAKTCSQEKDVPPPPPEEEDEEAAATAIAPAPPPLPPPVETIAAPPSTIPELQWLRCPASTRGNLTLAELSTFWGLLRGLFVRRETRELQAAQLLALGVRMSDDNKRKMRILEALGMIQLQVSVACPKMSPRAPPVRTHTR